MARRYLLAGIAGLLLAASPALAQKRPELDGPTQGDMNVQAGKRHAIADRALNQAYAKAVAEASPDGKIRLRAAQRAWIAFRDLDCAARTGSRGGSFYPAALSLCLEAVTDARTEVLKAEMSCAEGDMSCGGHRED
ncbi:MAG: DUF1311 domain-containing protein [Alphaproteobacteria bacterium]|nr:DUF1311 domain-containing protein [Alphaproteobacteria bacterium]MBU1513673.1 DUF1311 domain-containing protein [Alphaproteobacteria bacterium]MBU2094682.1 DUF1311 domain-containing protein [Alphaproteobacteria bacterium]MBU2150249.1 DUF1311 domain-containing protein [Alphaproteobacteria bacterium]MBU2309222.1 DUF1311 domain-containing protein [Alphaproteobacteria bacterium]